MSLPSPENIPFDTLSTLLRIAAQPGFTGSLRYRLPHELLVPDGVSRISEHWSMVAHEEEGILQPGDLCRLMAPYVLRIQEYRDEANKATQEARRAKSRMETMEKELKHLRAIAYPQNPFDEEYDDLNT